MPAPSSDAPPPNRVPGPSASVDRKVEDACSAWGRPRGRCCCQPTAICVLEGTHSVLRIPGLAPRDRRADQQALRQGNDGGPHGLGKTVHKRGEIRMDRPRVIEIFVTAWHLDGDSA